MNSGAGPDEHDYSAVTFPVCPSFQTAMPRRGGYSALVSTAKTAEGTLLKGVVACYKCPGDPDGAGSLPAPRQGDNCYTVPSRRAC